MVVLDHGFILIVVLDIEPVHFHRVWFCLVTSKVVVGMLDRCFIHMTMFRLYNNLQHVHITIAGKRVSDVLFNGVL